MEQYQHNGRKLIQMLFKSTEKGASTGPPAKTLPTKPPASHAHPPSKLFPPMALAPSRLGPETPTSPDPPSPLQWMSQPMGPRFALIKPTKKVKRAPARIPPLDAGPSTPAPSHHSNNHADADPANVTDPAKRPPASPALEREGDGDSDIVAADDVTVDDMNRVIDDLKQWRTDHARKMAAQYPAESSASPDTADEDEARQLAAMEADDDAEHAALMQLYERAKARWSTTSSPKDWRAAPPTTSPEHGDEDKIQAMLASPSTSDNVEKLHQLRHEVFELHVKDISRQLHRQMDLNNIADDDAFDAHLLELEMGVQTYANDLDVLLNRLGAYSSTIGDNNESDQVVA